MNMVTQSIFPAVKAFFTQDRIVFLIGVIAIWLYYRFCSVVIWRLNKPSHLTPQDDPPYDMLPSEVALFAKNNWRYRSYSADWLYFKSPIKYEPKKNEQTKLIVTMFKDVAKLVLRERDLTYDENRKGNGYYQWHQKFAKEKLVKHSYKPFGFICIGVVLALALLFYVHTVYGFELALPRKYAKGPSGPGEANFFMALILLFQPLFFYSYMHLLNNEGKRIWYTICCFKLYLSDKAQLTDDLSGEQTFYCYLPYAYALGVERQWARRCSKIFPEAQQILEKKLKKLKRLRSRLWKMQRAALKKK